MNYDDFTLAELRATRNQIEQSIIEFATWHVSTRKYRRRHTEPKLNLATAKDELKIINILIQEKEKRVR